MNTTIQKPKIKPVNKDSLIEQLRDIGRGVSSGIKNDLISGVASDALSSLFGTPKSGDLKPNQPINLNQPTPPQATDFPDRARPYPNFPESPFAPRFPRREQFNSQYSEANLAKLRQKEAQTAQKIEEIRLELKALIQAIKSVDLEIQKAVDENLVDASAYHLSFLDRLKTVLILMRQNLNDSASWLSVMRSRKKQRMYWSLYKKKGTEFGLNNERVVATQVG